MVNDIVLAKIDSLRRCIARLEAKSAASAQELGGDMDRQDIIALNLERAVQISVDIASHLCAHYDEPAPQTMVASFVILQRHQIISQETAEKMQRAVSFRNILVHQYQSINWDIVHSIVTEHLDDFRIFIREILMNSQKTIQQTSPPQRFM